MGEVRLWIDFRSTGKRAATIRYHRELLTIIERDWPGPLDAPACDVTAREVADFALRVAHYSGPRFNALVGILRAVVPHASTQLRRRKVSPKAVELPGQAEFSTLLRELDQAKHGESGLVVRFLALTGLRIKEAHGMEWRDLRDDGLYVRPEVAKNGRARFVPFIGEIQSVLDRLQAINDGARILPQASARKALECAAKRADLPALTHHDFRRLFATRCIESGVDLPTVARWMGHSDGGALLGRTYFHLADMHSQRMAGQVAIAV